jgi:predicted RNA-binding Zn ribbon-like protein
MDISETTTQADTDTGKFAPVGGALCLDFTNTVDWRLRPPPQELITSYADQVAWSRHLDLVTDAAAAALFSAAGAQPDAAAAALDRALTVREAIYRIFAAVADDQAPPPADLAILNGALGEALAHLQIVPSGSGFAWGWRTVPGALDHMVWPVVRSAGDLLTSDMLPRIHRCAGEGCGWLFLDTSRNGSRRWCTMEGCGNRAKARRHYRRTVSARIADDQSTIP